MKRHLLCAVGIAVLFSASAVGQDERGITVVPREQVQTERAKRWAVLIGVDKYQDEAGIGSLKYCGQDMKLLYQVLTGPNGGFAPENVLLMTQDAQHPKHRPQRSFIVTMVPLWLTEAKPEDDVLIAFSGHAVERDGKAYLLPSDAMHANPALTGIPVDLLKDWLANCKAKRKILILDACHSGAGKDAPSMSEAFWKDTERGEGFARLSSCGPKEKSNEDEALASSVGKGHGVFTYYLAEGLQGKGDLDRDGRVDVDEAYRYAYNHTRSWAMNKGLAQRPMKSGRVTGIMTIGYYRSLEELQRERQAAEARMKELAAESGRAGTEAARQAIAEAWAKEREALRLIEDRLRALEAGATDPQRAIAQYWAAANNVQSIERELAAKRHTYTAMSPIVTTLEQRLAEAKTLQEHFREAACAPLLVKRQALQRQRQEMAREMRPTHPKMRHVDAQIRRVAKDLATIGWKPPAGVKLPVPVRNVDLNDIRNWNVASGKWVAANGVITGSGDSALDLKQPLPSDFTLTFSLNVQSGMRPRVWFRGAQDLWFGNEGYDKTLFVHGPGLENVSGKQFQYQNNRDYRVSITVEGPNVSLSIDGKPVAKARRRVVQPMTLRIQGGDGWSKGTTSYSGFSISDLQAPEGHAQKKVPPLDIDLGGGVTMRLVYIPAGEFTMGSPANEKERYDNEGQHRIHITQGFYVGTTEVTNAQFRQFRPKHDSGLFEGLSLNGDDQPVANVSWEAAKAFCNWLGRKTGQPVRLPTEAEWEYASRAGSTGRFWWGESEKDAGRYANVADRMAKKQWGCPTIFDTDDGHPVAAPVGTYKPNAFGLYDTIGNVWEWCGDRYDEEYYTKSPSADPQGPRNGNLRVFRGGVWSKYPRRCRSAYRCWFDPKSRRQDLGFRVVVIAQE